MMQGHRARLLPSSLAVGLDEAAGRGTTRGTDKQGCVSGHDETRSRWRRRRKDGQTDGSNLLHFCQVCPGKVQLLEAHFLLDRHQQRLLQFLVALGLRPVGPAIIAILVVHA